MCQAKERSAMKSRHFFSAILSVVALFLMISAPAFAAGFPDVDGHPYESSILALADRGIIGGYENGNFGPDDLVMRQQFAKMIAKTLDLPVTGNEVCPFVDVSLSAGSDPFYPAKYVAACAQNNITKGKDATHFAPYDNITRQQVITMVVRAADNLAPGALMTAPDGWAGALSYSDPTHGANIKKAEYNGLLAGIWASTAGPGLIGWNTDEKATRGEVAEMLAQLLYRTGKVLTLTGPTGTQEFTMAELKALPAIEGYGGWKNKVGTIVGPDVYKGVPIHTLMDLVGGGTKITVVASDGYELQFDEDAVNGLVTMYDPASGVEITDIDGELAMILTYSVNGEPLPSENGALRIGFISPTNDQVTYSGSWAKMVSSIEVK
jgi:hypothetical protein